KWHGLHRLLFDEKIGILIVGETHLSPAQASEIKDDAILSKRIELLHSAHPTNPTASCGVAIVLNRELTNTKGVSFHNLIPGRALLAKIPWHGKRTVTVLGVYAPANSDEENAEFWDSLTELWLEKDLPVPDFLGGDLNVTPEPIDRLPHRDDSPRAVAALQRFKRLLSLQDGWRTTNPDTKDFTFISPLQTCARLDAILASPPALKNCRDWRISDAAGGLTDHRMVSVRYSAPGSPYIGRGRFPIPKHLLWDSQFIKFIIEEGVKLQTLIDVNDPNLQKEWAAFKEKIAKFARKSAKKTVGAMEQKKRKLQFLRNSVLNTPVTPDE
ncbi:Endonuclease/exonuclease/phosphatase, partial [Roridomyces roridus]